MIAKRASAGKPFVHRLDPRGPVVIGRELKETLDRSTFRRYIRPMKDMIADRPEGRPWV